MEAEKLRRKYPLNNKGIKDEWKGMLDHQNLVSKKLEEIENKVKNEKSVELKKEYEASVHYRDQLKRIQEQKKEIEKRKMDELNNMYLQVILFKRS